MLELISQNHELSPTKFKDLVECLEKKIYGIWYDACTDKLNIGKQWASNELKNCQNVKRPPAPPSNLFKRINLIAFLEF